MIDILSYRALEWYDDALCAQTDPEAFHPEKGGTTRPAKATCARCDVQQQCLDWAIANDERHGIWGGKSDRERQKIARVRRQEAEPDVIRAWARRQGIAISPTGAIPIAVRQAFVADGEAA